MAQKIENPVEVLIGAIVIAVAAGFAFYANQQTGGGAPSGSYNLVASFSSASGLAPGTDVRVAGVKVGSVAGLELDPKTYQARVTLSIRDGVELPDDSLAKVDSESLLGGTFIALEPGAGIDMLEAGDEFEFTQGAITLSGLIARVLTGGGGGDEKSGGATE